MINFSASTDYEELLNTFNFSLKANAGIKWFSANTKASYFRSIKEKSYNLSINYN